MSVEDGRPCVIVALTSDDLDGLDMGGMRTVSMVNLSVASGRVVDGEHISEVFNAVTPLMDQDTAVVRWHDSETSLVTRAFS